MAIAMFCVALAYGLHTSSSKNTYDNENDSAVSQGKEETTCHRKLAHIDKAPGSVIYGTETKIRNGSQDNNISNLIWSASRPKKVKDEKFCV